MQLGQNLNIMGLHSLHLGHVQWLGACSSNVDDDDGSVLLLFSSFSYPPSFSSWDDTALFPPLLSSCCDSELSLANTFAYLSGSFSSMAFSILNLHLSLWTSVIPCLAAAASWRHAIVLLSQVLLPDVNSSRLELF